MKPYSILFLILSFTTIFFIYSFSISKASDSQEINHKNWMHHPDIKKIRLIYEEVESKIKNKNLKILKKSFDYIQPYKPTQKIIYYDNNNTVRKYIEEAGSEDSSLTFNYYYDHNKILRFVFITGGAVNGTKLEHRIYFDDNAKKIWEIQKFTHGPGYTFPKVWPADELIFDPWKRFSENVE
ncbi:MAG: hypothetical protein AB1444_10540 [Spirochaetota bacterium]